MSSNADVNFLQWALPRMAYRWEGFRKPRGQVLKRIRSRIQELELSGGYAEYREYLKKHPAEWKVLERLCDVTISKFFRDRKLWDFLRDQVMPELMKQNEEVLSIWSAGCCNGEEPYSCSIIFNQLTESTELEGEISLLASDRNADVLERAQIGIYPAGALKELTDYEVETWFNRKEEAEEEKYKFTEKLANHVTFEKRDIRQSLPEGTFDLVFCRNLVFTYFDKTEQGRFLKQLKSRLQPYGYLVAGANEDLPETNWLQRLSKRHPVWRKKDQVYK